MLGFAAVSAGPISSVEAPRAPVVVRPPAFGSGGLLGFGPISAAPLATVPTFPPPEVVEPPVFVITGGGKRPRRPEPIVGYGFGFLPSIEGEAYGTVRAAGTGAATMPGLAGAAVGTLGVVGHGAGRLSIQATAIGDARAAVIQGKGAGVIDAPEGSATGRCDDDEAVIAWLLAA